jgi:hypothetical protein
MMLMNIICGGRDIYTIWSNCYELREAWTDWGSRSLDLPLRDSAGVVLDKGIVRGSQRMGVYALIDSAGEVAVERSVVGAQQYLRVNA